MKKVLYIKRRTFFFICICTFVLMLMPYIIVSVTPNITTTTLEDSNSGIIVIDPGHGGIDSGTIKYNVVEKDINLDTAKRLRALLVERGYKVVMTREEDISLEKFGGGSNRHRKDLDARVKKINSCNAQLYLSIHVNCSPKRSSTNGSIVFYNRKYEKNTLLAYDLQRSLNKVTLPGIERAIHNPVPERFYVTDRARIPGALIELGFISNSREREFLKKDEFREALAEALLNGVENYLNKPIYKLETSK